MEDLLSGGRGVGPPACNLPKFTYVIIRWKTSSLIPIWTPSSKEQLLPRRSICNLLLRFMDHPSASTSTSTFVRNSEKEEARNVGTTGKLGDYIHTNLKTDLESVLRTSIRDQKAGISAEVGSIVLSARTEGLQRSLCCCSEYRD